MTHIWDPEAGGYRLVCEATGSLSPVVSTDETAVAGLTWYSPHPEAEVLFLQRRRDELRNSMIRLGTSPIDVEVEIAKLSWNQLPSGKVVTDPRIPQEPDYVRMNRDRLFLTNSNTADVKPTLIVAVDTSGFPANSGTLTVTFSGFTQAAVLRVTPVGSVTLTGSDNSITFSSDAPQDFTIAPGDETHWFPEFTIRAV